MSASAPAATARGGRPTALVAVELLARLVIGCVFIYAALGKLEDRASLATAIENYHLLPAAASRVMAFVLPTIEIAVGAALLSGFLGRGASVLATGLLVMFAAAMVLALARGIDLSCGCFGSESDSVTPWTVARNVGLAVLAAVPAWTGITPWRSLRRVERAP